MKIETAQIADIEGLCDLLQILFSQEAEFAPQRERQRNGLRMILADENIGRIVVARANDRLIGMVNLLFTVSTALGVRVAILEDMVVLPEYRAAGLGSQLLQRALEIAKESGCGRVTLLTDGNNHAAQRFYTRHGFEQSTMIPMRLLQLR